MEPKEDWSIRMTAAIGRRIAAHRERRNLTVQAVADRCASLGLPLGRVTITKLEGGKRQAITPAELIVLAAALETAPVDLLFPIGHEADIEMFPGMRIHPDLALRWFTGELKLDLKPGVLTLREPQSGEESDTYLVQYHDALAGRLAALQAEADEALAVAQEDPKKRSSADYYRRQLGEYRDFIREPLRRIRGQMRERGMIVPEIPPGIDEDSGESYIQVRDALTRRPMYLTVTEVAQILGIDKGEVERLIRSGDLPAIKVGRSFRVPEDALSERRSATPERKEDA